MSKPAPSSPLPWKAAFLSAYGGHWDVTNDAGDPREEYSVTECVTEADAKFIAHVANCHADLVAVCEMVAARLHDNVYPGVRAAAVAVLAKVKGEQS